MITFKERENGFTYIQIHNENAEARIALQGAHLFHYQRHGEKPLVWLSESSAFEFGTAIRGGIPLCWPWFGKLHDSTLPQHGFARISRWELAETRETDPGTTDVVLKLKPNEQSRKLWPYDFHVQLHVSISTTLSIALSTTNLDEKPFELTSALHTYFTVSQIENITIDGLKGKPYFDALSQTQKLQSGTVAIREEVDRIYQKTDSPITIKDTDRSITIENEGSNSVVVWNPWIRKCAAMSGMNPDSYKTMLCIESANAGEDIRTLEPGETHTLKAIIT